MYPLNGPPDAVRSILLIFLSLFPSRHWKIALCSLSTGRSLTPFSPARFMTSSPPATRVSLLARAMSLPDSMAWYVGTSPLIPMREFKTMSASAKVAAAISPSSPHAKRVSASSGDSSLSRASASSLSAVTATSGLNSLSCFLKSSLFFPHVMDTTLNLSGNLFITSRL